MQKKVQKSIMLGMLLVLALLALSACSGGQQAAGLPKEISVAAAHKEYEAGTFFLDVRQPEEWAEIHIPGATLVPLGELEAHLSELSQDQKIVVYCRSGNRSQEGRDILLKAGFSEVTSMAGGIKDWAASGYPTEAGQ
jgi:rhodanese-related sulfurtransferase